MKTKEQSRVKTPDVCPNPKCACRGPFTLTAVIEDFIYRCERCNEVIPIRQPTLPKR